MFSTILFEPALNLLESLEPNIQIFLRYLMKVTTQKIKLCSLTSTYSASDVSKVPHDQLWLILSVKINDNGNDIGIILILLHFLLRRKFKFYIRSSNKYFLAHNQKKSSLPTTCLFWFCNTNRIVSILDRSTLICDSNCIELFSFHIEIVFICSPMRTDVAWLFQPEV